MGTNLSPKTPEARERQQAGQHKGLLHAAQKRKKDRSANYATNFCDGQMASDFERSAAAAGETRKDLRGHYALLDRALLMLCGFFGRAPAALPKLPLDTGTASPRAPKLVRALALLAWRPVRLFRMQERWERLAVFFRLQELIGWRKKHGELTVNRAEKFHWDLSAILENYNWHLDPRQKLIERRFWNVWRVYRGLIGVVGAVLGRGAWPCAPTSEISNPESPILPEAGEPGGASDSELPIADGRLPIEEPPGTDQQSAIDNQQSVNSRDGGGPDSGDARDLNRQSAIENRQSLVQFRGTPHYEQFHPNWLERLDDLSPQAIGNPFQSPSHALKAERKLAQPAAVKDPKDWQKRTPAPRPPEAEPFELEASDAVRTPSERELRRLVRQGALTVPGSFKEFLALVEAALGSRDSGMEAGNSGVGAGRESPIVNHKSQITNAKCQNPNTEPRKPNTESRTPSPESRVYLRAFAESLWNRMNVFSPRVAQLRKLLEATLVWDSKRFLRLWLDLLPVEYGYGEVGFFRRTHGPERLNVAWGDDETTVPWREGKQRPAEAPASEAEERKQRGGELQRALRIWWHAVKYALMPVMRSTHQVTVALYDWAVSRFGIREEFLVWRPNLSSVQRDTRDGRPEWALRVVTVTGKTLVKLRDGQIFEPDE